MFPSYSSQVHPPQLNAGHPGSATPQVMGNPGMQVQPQMGLFNPQGSSDSNTHPSVPRFPYQFPQNAMNNVIPQMPGQFFAHNAVNPPQFFNQNVNFGFPNNQWNLPNNNLIQTVNHLMQMQLQIPNFAQAGPSGLPFFATNQAFQASPAFNGNTQFLPANGAAQQPMNANFLGQPQHGNIPSLEHPHLSQSSLSFSDAAKSQGGLGHATRINTKGHSKNSSKNNVNRNKGYDTPHTRFQNFTTQTSKNAKRSFSNQGDSFRKGRIKRDRTEKSFKKQDQKEEKRPIPFFYTEQEVRQWREERKKNYPSKGNIEKKSQKLANTVDYDGAAKLRRQQLKEILAKQAELGCEIAEIPPSYLSDMEPPHNGVDRRGAFSKKQKYQHNPNKRGRFGKRNSFSENQTIRNHTPRTREPCDDDDDDHHSKEQRYEINNRPALQSNRKPTLWKKLVGGDMNREKRHLLQVLRFMVMNSFFADNDKPLRFPSVIVKESGNENMVVSQGSALEEPLNDGEERNGDLGKDRGTIANTEKEKHREEGEIID